MRNVFRSTLLATMLLVVACDSAERTTGFASTAAFSGGGGGGGSGSGSLHFLQSQPATPTFTQNPVTFWAVQGQDRRAEITYSMGRSGNQTIQLAMLRIRPRTQMTRPNGTLLAPGDSILITMTVVDLQKLIVQFEPSGLRFGGRDPATLTMSYRFTDHDLNHDGVVDAADAAIVATFSIFKQESNTLPWNIVRSTLTADAEQISANIPGFTNYVIAY